MIEKVLSLYQEYTGKTLSPEQQEMYKPWILRAVRMMEQRLGWPLDNPVTVNVIGRSKSDCGCKINLDDLAEAPEQKGNYRFFPINTTTPNLAIDPFKKVHGVYLCRVEPEGIPEWLVSDKNDAVIIAKITNSAPILFQSRFGKYLHACKEVSLCQQACNSDCTDCAMLLVDADWVTIDDLPPELIFLICDYVDWMADDGISNRAIRSESVDGHSVSYGSWITTAPYQHTHDTAILRTWMGPYGSVGRKLIW